jgi:glycosyltransferase involved in cell wall biosynthesis
MATLSIGVPCYNSERFIRTTIESALCQNSPTDEVLISDDNSPDRSFDIIREYESVPRVRIIRPPKRMTLGAHYRFLLENATTDFICFLSSDDALVPSFTATMQRNLEEGVGMIAASALECDAHLVPTRIKGAALPKQTFTPPDGFLHFTAGNTYIISVAVFDRRMLLTVPPLPPEADLATDWYWALSMGARGKLRFIREPMGYYRVHDSNAANSNHHEWRKATYAMLTFLQSQLSPEHSRVLDRQVEMVREQLGAMAKGDAQPPELPSGLKDKMKDLAKELLAVRYRRLPDPIKKAEGGISVTLQPGSGSI